VTRGSGGRRPEVERAIGELQRLAELFTERRRQIAREIALTETQWRVLEEVAGDDFLPSLFARRRACSPAAVSRTLRQLQEGGLVTAEIGTGDARQRVYRLTPRGRRLLERIHARREEAVAELWSGFSTAQLRAFSDFAARLSRGLEAYVDERGA
jgi:DNA-binding MarR family transcriptional regulator